MKTDTLQTVSENLEGFELQATGLVITGTPTSEHWLFAGQQLRLLNEASRWAIGDWVNFGKAQREWGDLYAHALSTLDLEPIRARQYSMTSAAFSPERRRWKVCWSHYREVAGFEEDIQDRMLTLAEEQRWGSAELSAHVRDVRHQARCAGRSWPAGKYGLIYADPPWRYESGTARPSDAIEEHYPTMSLEEIQALGPKIRAIAASNCVLYLWVPAPKVYEACSILDAWDFSYRTTGVWVKDRLGLGYWFRQRHELLFVAVRGHPIPPADNERPDSIIAAPRGEHSAKPVQMADTLDVIFPGVPKVELFARQARPGWAAWGNEALGDGHDLLPASHHDAG